MNENKLDFFTAITIPIRFVYVVIVICLISPLFILFSCFNPKVFKRDIPVIYKDVSRFVVYGAKDEVSDCDF